MKNFKAAAAGTVLAFAMLFTACSGGESVTYSRGKVDSNNVYTNEMLKIAAQFDDNWEAMSDSELVASAGVSGSADSDFESYMETNGTVTDFFAYYGDSGANVNVTYEKLSVLYGSILDEESYVNLSIGSLQDSLGDDAACEKTSKTFAGSSRSCIKTDYMGMAIMQVCIKAGDYMGVITFTALDESEVNAMMGYFKPISD